MHIPVCISAINYLNVSSEDFFRMDIPANLYKSSQTENDSISWMADIALLSLLKTLITIPMHQTLSLSHQRARK